MSVSHGDELLHPFLVELPCLHPISWDCGSQPDPAVRGPGPLTAQSCLQFLDWFQKRQNIFQRLQRSSKPNHRGKWKIIYKNHTEFPVNYQHYGSYPFLGYFYTSVCFRGTAIGIFTTTIWWRVWRKGEESTVLSSASGILWDETPSGYLWHSYSKLLVFSVDFSLAVSLLITGPEPGWPT